jgi:hypothetical protein
VSAFEPGERGAVEKLQAETQTERRATRRQKDREKRAETQTERRATRRQREKRQKRKLRGERHADRKTERKKSGCRVFYRPEARESYCCPPLRGLHLKRSLSLSLSLALSLPLSLSLSYQREKL